MPQKDRIDAGGALALVAFSMLLGFNQVVIKVVNEGIQPVYFAGLRSAGAIVCIIAWMRLRGMPIMIAPGTWRAGLLIGLCFSAEFLCLFMALDLTTVVRSSIMFYSMPIWLAMASHFLLPDSRITPQKALGLGVAFAGVIMAILTRGQGGGGSLAGDLLALGGALGWAGIILCARGTAMRRVRPEVQLLWQVGVSALVLLIVSPFFGPALRDPQAIHLWSFAFQTVVVASAGFVFWLWLVSIYPPSGVASFSFLTPIFGIAFGWLILGEEVGPGILAAGALVTAGIVIINRAQVPQKVRRTT